MKAIRGIAAAIVVAALLGGVAASAVAGDKDPPVNEGVCTGLDSGKIDTPGEDGTLTITAPAGFLIDEYCVKAGSINQGDGPEYVTVSPPAASVTISHSTGKDISHYSASYTPIPPTEITGTVVFTNPTCVNPQGAGFTAAGTGYTGALTSGTVGPGNTITVTLTALPGFVLVGQTVFTHTFPTPTGCEGQPTPLLAGATFVEATCTTGPAFQFVRTFLAGLGNRPFYLVDGPLVGGMPVAGASYTITAQSVVGFILTGQTVWTHTFAATPTNCGSTPPPPPPSSPPPPPRVCPDGMPPTPGEGAFDPNDDCKRPPAPPAPPAAVPPTTAVTPAATPPPPPTPPAATPPATKPPVAKPKPPQSKPGKPAAAKPPKPDKPPVKLTGNPKKDDCKKMKNGLLNCGGTTVVPGSG